MLELFALIDARIDEHLIELDAMDIHDLMNFESSKWIGIVDNLALAGVCSCSCDGPNCKGT